MVIVVVVHDKKNINVNIVICKSGSTLIRSEVQVWSKEPLALEGCEASYQIVTGYHMSAWRKVGHERPHSLHGQTGIEAGACSD